MLRYPFVEFIFVYNHDIGQFLSRELGGIVPELDIIKDLQESSHALAH